VTKGKNKLSARFVDTVKEAGRYGDGHGLYLIMKKGGGKSWSFVWIRGGVRREMGLGSASTVSLAQARKAAETVREQIGEGKDPIAERNKEKPKTFEEVGAMVLATLEKTWKKPKHGANWRRAINVTCKPIHGLSINEITTQDVLKVLKPVWDKTPETGRRLRARMERVIDYGTAHGWRTGDNPARWKGHLSVLLETHEREVKKHHAAMPYAEVPAFIERLQGKDTMPAIALEFTILTAMRTEEVLGALWDEIDLDAALWTIPAERMKMKRPHSVPLSSRAMEIVQELHDTRRSKFIFAGQGRDKPLSNMSMLMTMRRMGITGDMATVHGFRSSFRDWCGDKTTTPREIAEAALAHTVGSKVEQSYRRGDALEKRRGLMQLWSDYHAGVHSGDVVQLHG